MPRICQVEFRRASDKEIPKKLKNRVLALSLCFMLYNFARPHKTLANPYPRTPAMTTGLTNHIWTVEELVKLTS